jgi:hypothetical protein
MPNDFLWELQKLCDRFGVDAEAYEKAGKLIFPLRRGPKPQKDDRYLEKIQAGASVQEAVGADADRADEVRIRRKARRAAVESQYYEQIERLAGLFVTLSRVDRGIYVKRLAADAGPSQNPDLIALDVIRHLLKRAPDQETPEGDKDSIEAASFHLGGIREIGPESVWRADPRRLGAIKAVILKIEAQITQQTCST